jgi:hypothetical protein
MAVAGLALLVGADLRHRCLVGRRVVEDRDLGCHAAHRLDPTAPGNLLLSAFAGFARAFIGEKRRRSARPWPAMIVSSAAISTGFDKAEFADRGGDLRDLRVTVRPAVSRIGQEPINRPYCYGFGQIHRRFPRARARAFIGEKQWIGMGAAVLRIRREPIDLSSRAGARASTGEKRTSEGMNSGAWRSGAKSTAQVR